MRGSKWLASLASVAMPFTIKPSVEARLAYLKGMREIPHRYDPTPMRQGVDRPERYGGTPCRVCGCSNYAVAHDDDLFEVTS